MRNDRSSELPVEIQDVNLRETIDEAIFSVQDEIDSKPLTVETQIDESFPKLRTDLTKINQILFLLLENAVKVAAPGFTGTVERCYAAVPQVRYAPQPIKQLFLKLLLNALDAVGDSDHIRLDTRARSGAGTGGDGAAGH